MEKGESLGKKRKVREKIYIEIKENYTRKRAEFGGNEEISGKAS